MMGDGHLKKQVAKPSKHPLANLKKHYQGLDAFTRHKQMINNYFLYYPGAHDKLKKERDTSKDKNDYDIIRENHKFLWNSDDITEAEKSWDAKLAKRYYDKLFKEYCIADLTFYEKNKVAMRWRIEKEVKSGKGQFICGEKHCEKDKGLESWEVNFTYNEHGEKKNALVKLRLCPACSAKLNFHSMKKRVSKEEKKKSSRKRQKKNAKDEKSKKKSKTGNEKEEESSSSSSDDDSNEDETEEKEKNIDDSEIKAREEAKLAEEASKVWSRDPFAEKSQEEKMDEFLDDLLF